MRYMDSMDETIRKLRIELSKEEFIQKLRRWKQELQNQVDRYEADAKLFRQEGNVDMAEGQEAAARMIQKKISRIQQELPYEKPAGRIQNKKRKQKKTPAKEKRKAAAVFGVMAEQTKGEK